MKTGSQSAGRTGYCVACNTVQKVKLVRNGLTCPECGSDKVYECQDFMACIARFLNTPTKEGCEECVNGEL